MASNETNCAVGEISLGNTSVVHNARKEFCLQSSFIYFFQVRPKLFLASQNIIWHLLQD